jgi:hypothetical protein
MYLLNTGKDNPMYGKKHDDLTREHMQEIYTEERRERIGNLNRGKELTPEHREHLRQLALARPPMTDETRAKVSANSAKILTLEITALDGSSTVTVRGLLAAAKHINCGEKTVRTAIKGTGLVKNTCQVQVRR